MQRWERGEGDSMDDMDEQRALKRWLSGVLLAVLLIGLGGCSIGPAKPRMRAGCVPYPGLFTLFTVADPANMDAHSYGQPPLFKQGSRGIVYTEQAGFIDLAHLRLTVDWGWYYYQRIRTALREGSREVVLPTNKSSRLLVELHYPAGWSKRPAAERRAAIDEISLRLAQDAVWVFGLWHEIATYFGYASWVVISEEQSAFTHEDTFSHLVGLYVLEQVIREGKNADFDEAVTTALTEMLDSLEPYDPDGTYEAVLAVEGLWWDGSGAIRRNLEPGLNGGPMRPWLIPAAGEAKGRYGEAWHVPGMHDLEDEALRGLATIRIQPRIWQRNAILQAAGTEEDEVRVADLPVIIDHIHAQFAEVHGPEVGQP